MFYRTCAYVPKRITSMYHWGVIRITKRSTEGERETLTVQWDDSFLTSGQSKVMSSMYKPHDTLRRCVGLDDVGIYMLVRRDEGVIYTKIFDYL